MRHGHLSAGRPLRASYRLAALLVFLALWPAGVATGQTPDAALGTISDVEGSAYRIRQTQRAPAATGQLVIDGDQLETDIGRLEVVLANGVDGLLHLDHETAVDLLSAEVLRLRRGRLRVTVARSDAATPSRVDTPAAQVLFQQAGEYLVTLLADSGARLSVVRGRAELQREGSGTEIGAGEQVETRATGGVAQPTTFNTAAWDAFDRWVESRRVTRIDRYATRILGTRLRPERGRSREAPMSAPPARPTYAPMRQQVWLPTWPYWILGPSLFGRSVLGPSEISELLERPTVEVTTVIQITPDEDVRDEPQPAAEPPTRLTIVGLPAREAGAPATTMSPVRAIGARGSVSRTPAGRRRSVIVLPRGGTTRSGSEAPVNGGSAATAPEHGTAASPSRAVIRPGTGVTSPRALSRSTRYQHLTGRSARRAAARRR